MSAEILPFKPEGVESEYSRAQLKADIDAAVRNGMNLLLNEGEPVDLTFDDHAGHHVTHTLQQREAENVDEALWTAGEFSGIESVRNGINHELQHAGFNLDARQPVEITIQAESERREAA